MMLVADETSAEAVVKEQQDYKLVSRKIAEPTAFEEEAIRKASILLIQVSSMLLGPAAHNS